MDSSSVLNFIVINNLTSYIYWALFNSMKPEILLKPLWLTLDRSTIVQTYSSTLCLRRLFEKVHIIYICPAILLISCITTNGTYFWYNKLFHVFFYEILAVSDDTIMWKVSPDTSPTTGASTFLNLHFQYFITELSTLKSPKQALFPCSWPTV